MVKTSSLKNSKTWLWHTSLTQNSGHKNLLGLFLCDCLPSLVTSPNFSPDVVPLMQGLIFLTRWGFVVLFSLKSDHKSVTFGVPQDCWVLGLTLSFSLLFWDSIWKTESCLGVSCKTSFLALVWETSRPFCSQNMFLTPRRTKSLTQNETLLLFCFTFLRFSLDLLQKKHV